MSRKSVMSQVTIYTKPYCPYCVRAVMLLEKKGVAFTEIEAAFDPAKRQEMVQRAGGRATFPQIFVGDRHIGGCDEMMALDRDGKLDPLLRAA
jgi:glutaredoxin 3